MHAWIYLVAGKVIPKTAPMCVCALRKSVIVKTALLPAAHRANAGAVSPDSKLSQQLTGGSGLGKAACRNKPDTHHPRHQSTSTSAAGHNTAAFWGKKSLNEVSFQASVDPTDCRVGFGSSLKVHEARVNPAGCCLQPHHLCLQSQVNPLNGPMKTYIHSNLSLAAPGRRL